MDIEKMLDLIWNVSLDSETTFENRLEFIREIVLYEKGRLQNENNKD